uniref:DUF5615 domain-containing protein n=1 Tax=Solibacter usitatus (strain Ellin6076) TaxID=234267 RepID=Q01P24_SOLUE
MALSPDLAIWPRPHGHDAIHANEIAMNRAPDTEILSAAFEQDRIVITADLDFPRLLAKLASVGPGLILLRGGNYSEAQSLECVRRVLMSVPPRSATLPCSGGREANPEAMASDLTGLGRPVS